MFFVQNVVSMFDVFDFVMIILTVMQVDLIINQQQFNERFQAVLYEFVIFAMMTLMTIIDVIATFFVALFIYNLIVTLIYHCEREKKWSNQKQTWFNVLISWFIRARRRFSILLVWFDCQRTKFLETIVSKNKTFSWHHKFYLFFHFFSTWIYSLWIFVFLFILQE